MENSATTRKRTAPDGADDEDDAVLREALAFIGDFEFDDDGDAMPDLFAEQPTHNVPSFWTIPTKPLEPLPVPAVSPASTQSLDKPTAAQNSSVSDVTTRPKGATSRPHSYSKRRDELQYLRGLVTELELRLTNLRKRSDEQSADQQGQSEGANDRTASSQAMTAAWEQVAASQYEQRHRAEMENIKLKTLLEDQIQVGKSLERVLSRKRPKGLESLDLKVSQAPASSCATKSTSQSPDASYFGDTNRVFADLFVSVNAQYPETARMFAKAEHTCPAVNHHENRLVHDPELGLVLQSSECRIFPFKYEETVQTLWDSMPDIAIQGPHQVDKTDTQQKIKLQVDVSLGATHAAMEVFIASQRYDERVESGERTVFVSTAVLNPSEISDIDMDGIHMRHKGWCIVEPMPMSESKGCTRHATKMTVYSIATPETHGKAVQDHSRKVGTLTNFVMSSISFDRETRHQMIENRLFERSLRSERNNVK